MSHDSHQAARCLRSPPLPIGETTAWMQEVEQCREPLPRSVVWGGSFRMSGIFPSPLRGEGRVRGGCSPQTLISPDSQESQSGSDRLAAAGLLLFACPRPCLEHGRTAQLARRAQGRTPGVKRSSQEKRHPAPARGGRCAHRVPCGARRQQAARQLGHPWPRTVWLYPADGSAPRRRRGARDQQQDQRQDQQQSASRWRPLVIEPPLKCAIFPVRPERSEAQSKDTYSHALRAAAMLTRAPVHRVTP